MDPCSQILAIMDLLWTNELNLTILHTDSCRLARGDPKHLQCSLAHSNKASAGFDPEYEALPQPLEMDAMLKITSSFQKGMDGSCFLLLQQDGGGTLHPPDHHNSRLQYHRAAHYDDGSRNHQDNGPDFQFVH